MDRDPGISGVPIMLLFPGEEAWRIKAEMGVPMDMILMKLAQDNQVPTWDKLLDAAERDGANIAKLCREMEFFIREAYTPEDATEIITRLRILATHYPKRKSPSRGS